MSGISGEITENGITTCNLTDYDGSTKYVVSADISAAGWKFSYAMNTEELYRDVTNIIIIFLVLIPVIIVIAAIICRTVVKGSFKALGTVSEAAEVMTRGDLSVKFDYSADDEIGAVCRIIEQTNNTLRKYVNDISTHLDEMSHGDFTHLQWSLRKYAIFPERAPKQPKEQQLSSTRVHMQLKTETCLPMTLPKLSAKCSLRLKKSAA